MTVAIEQDSGAGLDPAIALTEQMLDMAQRQQWDTLAALENQRRVFLENYFSIPSAAKDRQAVAANIHHILELDRQIIAAAEVARQAAMDGIKQQDQARRADRAYSTTQLDPSE